jgi:hypothetical protein
MAVELSVNEFRSYFHPIFSDTSIFTNYSIENQLEQAIDEVSEVTFGKYYKRAAYYLTAHFLSLFVKAAERAVLAPGSTAVHAPNGIMTAASVGDLSKTIEVPEYKRADDKLYASTSFGQEYLRLRNKMCRGPLVANLATTINY